MALRFIDSAGQHYIGGTGSPLYIQRKWTFAPDTEVGNNGSGRRGMPYINPGGAACMKTLTQNNNWLLGVAFQLGGGTQATIHQVWNNGGVIATLNLNADSTISVDCAGNPIYTSTIAVNDPTTWHYYEVAWFFNGSTSTGSMHGTVWVDGSPWGNFSGTAPTQGINYINGSFTANQVGLAGPGNYMDYYVFDTNATDINGHTTTNTANIGDIQVVALLPITDITTNWSVTGGTNTTANSAVNDFVSTSEGTFSSPDDDTSYIYTTAVGSSEGFNYQSISTFTGTIFGAQYSVCAKKTAEGSREIALTLNTSTVLTENFLSGTNFLSDYYVYYIAPLDSILGTPWTVANYDSAQFGITLVG